MSSAELSLEISHLVSRAMGGEPIDVATKSEELAARFAGLGMSAELIGKAISRAAGMVGIALDGAGKAIAAADPPGAGGPVNGFHAGGASAEASARPGEAEQAAALRRVFLGERAETKIAGAKAS